MGKIVLIITRDYDSDVERFAEENEYPMSCVDSSMTRSVWEFGHGDFPLEVWKRLEAFLIKTRGQRPPLFLRREDPGLGIVIPEIDELPGGFLNPLPEVDYDYFEELAEAAWEDVCDEWYGEEEWREDESELTYEEWLNDCKEDYIAQTAKDMWKQTL